ncbi:MAG: hypothetical protein ACRC7O_06255 [Fimbriiglobus sp.]
MSDTKTPADPKAAAALAALVGLIRAVAETIREVGEAPSGTVFAALQAAGVTLTQYERIVQTLVDVKAVEKRGHLLVWIGK